MAANNPSLVPGFHRARLDRPHTHIRSGMDTATKAFKIDPSTVRPWNLGNQMPKGRAVIEGRVAVSAVV